MGVIRRSLSFASAVVGGAVVALVLLAVVGVVALSALNLDDAGDVRVDEVVLDQTYDDLDDVELLLEALPDYDGTGARHSEVVGCTTDSGQLFQPAVRHGWALDEGTDGDAVLEQVAADLVTAGWARVAPRPTDGDALHLTLDRPGLAAVATLYTDARSGGSPVVSATIAGAQPCSWAD